MTRIALTSYLGKQFSAIALGKPLPVSAGFTSEGSHPGRGKGGNLYQGAWATPSRLGLRENAVALRTSSFWQMGLLPRHEGCSG